jgi:hypothetical protein
MAVQKVSQATSGLSSVRAGSSLAWGWQVRLASVLPAMVLLWLGVLWALQ